MHPIERLRWIARARDETPTTLAAEAGWTLAELALEEPPALVTACRRLLESHVTVGPLWWVAATVLVAPDPDQAARRAVGELCSDPTAELLARALSQRLGSEGLIVVASPADTVRDALGHRPSSVVRVVGSSPGLRGEVRGFAALVEEASGWEFDEALEAVDGAAVVLVEALAAGPRGVVLNAAASPLLRAARDSPVPLWAVAGVGRVLNDQLLGEMLRRAGGEVQLIEPGAFEALAGPAGLENATEALARSACPAAPELLVRAG
ncbi:MAG TPA: hypothetical protein VK217_01120 [Acidimicrobiales bacterium]|nr:hypothetical protein [Acidimicrobiales bacterium]